MNEERKRRSDGYHHGNLRQALLAAARGLLEEKGPHGLALREIARRVGVSAPSAYHHFPSLDAIAVALAQIGLNELHQAMLAAPTNERGMLRLAGRAYIDFARKNPQLYRLIFGERFTGSSEQGAQLAALRAATHDFLIERLGRRLPPEQTAVAAVYLWSLIHGLTMLVLDSHLSADPDFDALVDKVLSLAGTGIASSGTE